MSKFSMTEVCHAVMREGITAYIEHTGGGQMTIYAGSQVDDVWTVAAGPGRYPTVDAFRIAEDDLALVQAGAVREAVANTEAFSVGPGDMAGWVVEPERVWICPELATEAEIADQIIHQVREHDAQTPVVTPVKTWPETTAEKYAFTDWQYEVGNGDTLRGFRDWLDVQNGND
jgi:hypothetical protein